MHLGLSVYDCCILRRRRVPGSSGPEEELILAIAGWSLARVDLRAISLLAERSIDWNRFLELTQSHGLAPVAADCLGLSCAKLPGAVAQALDGLRRENAKRCLVFSTELARIAEQCEGDGIRLVALKGPTLAALYPEPSWRVFGDLDLLIAPNQIEGAVEGLARLGYLSAEPPSMRRARRDYRTWEFELPLVHRDLGVHLDLHWRLLPRGFPAHLPVEDLMNRTETVAIEGTPVRVLEPADQLLFLSAHGAKHSWSSLDLVIDVCRVLNGFADRDYDAAFARAREYSAARMLDFALRAAKSWTTLPHNFLTAGPVAENHLRVPLALSDSARAKLIYLTHRIFVPTVEDWESLRDPWRGLFPLHVPWRLLRTGWKVLSRGLP